MNNQKGKIVSVNISEEKGTTKKPVKRITMDENGIVGDAHAGPWHRQISLLATKSIQRFSKQAGQNFNYGDFAENLTTSGVELLQTNLLDRYRIGQNVELEITQHGKKCHGGNCAIFLEVGKCVMPKEGIFCRTIQGGEILPGDTIKRVPRPWRIHILTLSDRASAGEYEDLSGPKTEELLRQHYSKTQRTLEITRTILPDDATLLRNTINASINNGIDAIFTTGGTGIGPRDITPEIITEIAEKLLPGIMEHIRNKFGADKPNALLSRSVAGVAKQTLLYALPGSTKAVNEYIPEIMKTFDHALYMLHGLNAH